MNITGAVRVSAACFFVLVLGLGPVRAATFYVAKDGRDSDPGTEAKPWATVRHGVAAMAAGDTLVIRAGTYPESIEYPPSGSPERMTTIKALPGEQVVIQANDINHCAVVHDRSYLLIQGLVFDASDLRLPEGASGQIIEVSGGSHITIDGCEVRGGHDANGIIGGNHCTYTNNHIHHINVGGEAGYYGMYPGGHDNLIAHNTIHHANGWGIHAYNTRGGADRNTFIANRIYHCGFKEKKPGELPGKVTGSAGPWSAGRFGGIILSSGSGDVAYNNVIFDNDGPGIFIGYGAVDPQIYNNTLYGNNRAGNDAQVRIGDPHGTATNPLFSNNIVYGPSGKDIVQENIKGTVTMETNLLGRDPRFVDAAKGDFHLKPGSPAIDAGTDARAPKTDLEGKKRPQGGGCDIGAYER